MSQTDSDDLEQYRGTAGAEVKTADIASNEHPLEAAMDEDATKERIYDPKLAGERFVDFYDDPAAAIREYLSNAETACIRRCRQELLDAGLDESEIPDGITELIEAAIEVAGYEPLIEVEYDRKPDNTRFVISDNGIGISTEEYKVVQRVGYSTSHDSGERLGNFGIGWMSGFQLVGVDGAFTMRTRSYLTDESYATAEYVANFENLEQTRDSYGTTFRFPGFSESAKSIDVPAKVEEYVEGMRVPVVYRDYDESGQETGRSEEYHPTNMEDDYADDSLVITVENEFFKAVMSPDDPEDRRGLSTYNITMPIRRNTEAFGSNNQFDAPWKWDFRAKREDGPIVACESDPSLVGLVPIEDTKYDRLMDEFKDDSIELSKVPDDAIVMPEPASSRDSFESGHDDFWKHVSQQLREEWRDVARERLSSLDSWDDFLDMDRSEKQGVFRAYNDFGPRTTSNEPQTVRDKLKGELGVDLPLDLCEKLDKSRGKVMVVSRWSSRPDLKSSCSRKKIWKVIDEAPDGVYMGKSISAKKAEIVWGLGDTHLVRVGSSHTYAGLESTWGWEKAKDLPTRDLSEKLPELDDDIAQKYERDSSNSSSSSSSTSTGGDGRNPETYRAKVRVGSRNGKYISTHSVDDLADTLENDDSFDAGRYRCEYLVICKEDEIRAVDAGRIADKSRNIATTRVPKYVYEYLSQKPNVYESTDELVEEKGGTDVTLSDGTTMCTTDLPSTDCLINCHHRTEEEFRDSPEDLVELFGYDPDDFDRYTFVDRGDLSDSWGADSDATVIKTENSRGFEDFEDYEYHSTTYEDLLMEHRLGDVDESSDEFEALFGYRYGEPDGDELETLLDVAQRAGIGSKN